MSPTHDELALAAPYVLGALDVVERRAFESHLASCPACTDEVRSLSRVAAALAQTVPQVTPRSELRARVLGAATGATAIATPPPSESSPHRLVPEWLPVAAALIVAAGLGVYAWQLQQRVAILEGRLDAAEQRTALAEQASADARRAVDDAQTSLAVLAAPDLVRIDLAGQGPGSAARGRVLWSRNRGMVFTAANLPPAPAGRVYQVWVVTAQAPVSAGLLSPDASGGATVYFQTPSDIAAPLAIAVTLEPAGGVPAPTGARYLVGAPL
jgi:anti-sigma-K factor RskA